MTSPAAPAILIHSRFLHGRLPDWDPGGVRLFTSDDLAGGVSAEMAESVEVLVSGGEPLSAALVEALPRLRLVACFSTGYAGIDLAHLRGRGVALTTAGGVNAHDVADHAVALLLGLWHGVPTADRRVREGIWRDGLAPRPSLRGRRAGIVGLGRIGEATATRLAALEMNVRWWGPRGKPEARFERAASLVTLAQESDVLVVTSRAVDENRGVISAEVLAALGPKGVIVNVSRGFLIDEAALVDALREGRLGGAALDVFVDEPTDPAVWRDLPNVLLSPHIAGFTQEAGVQMFGQLRENIRRQLAGEALLSPVLDPA